MSSGSKAASMLNSCLRSSELPCARSVLANGLRVIVCRRAGSGQVGVNVCYHAGSGAEEPGKAGLAHLVEHLMYAGAEHHPRSYVLALEQAGATTINANATEDYSTYFETVPVGALDLALWMEAERMSCLRGALEQEKLDREREVVRNEIHQRDSEPFGDVKRIIRAHAYPAGHPYRHIALGLAEELEAVTLADVARWLTRFHGAANALVVIAGDVAPDSVPERVERFFGDIVAGAAPRPWPPWVAPLAERTNRPLSHASGRARVYKVWNVPAWSSYDHAMLELAAHTLAAGAGSILHQRLVCGRELATQIGFELSEGELGSQLLIYADPRSESAVADLGEALDQEVTRFLRSEPPLDQLDAARMIVVGRSLEDLDRLTGPKSLTHALAVSELLAANPVFYRERLGRIASADPEEVLASVARWLGAGVLTLEVRSSAKRQLAPWEAAPCRPARAVMRSLAACESPARNAPCIPAPSMRSAAAVQAGLSGLRPVELKNGLTLLLVERALAPLAHVRLVLRGAVRAELAWHPRRCGLAGMAAAMLGRGTIAQEAIQIERELAALGAQFKSRLGLDAATLALSVLSFNLPPALELLAEIALHPVFAPEEFRRVRRRRLAEIEGEKARPFDFALRVMPRLVFGDAHPFAQPLSGLGDPFSLEALDPGQVADFYQRWARPGLAALVVVGEIRSQSLVSSIEGSFGDWIDHAAAASRTILPAVAQAEPARHGSIFAVNRPGPIQSAISVGWSIPSLQIADEAACLLARALAADMFSSRLNLLLRERMGCSYGLRSFAAQAADGGLYLIHASVAADMTGAAVREIRRELEQLCAAGAITEGELARARTYVGARLAALAESGAQAADAAETIASRGLCPDYYERLLAQVQRVRSRDIVRAARSALNPDAAAWLLAADMSVVGEQLPELGRGIRRLDADGAPIAS